MKDVHYVVDFVLDNTDFFMYTSSWMQIVFLKIESFNKKHIFSLIFEIRGKSTLIIVSSEINEIALDKILTPYICQLKNSNI